MTQLKHDLERQIALESKVWHQHWKGLTRVSKTYESKKSKTQKCHGQYDGHHKM
jgi:hypothetical protein